MQDPQDDRNGLDRLAAIVRDPRSVFLHWELAGPRSAEAVKLLGPECRWCVRLLNLTDGSSSTVPVDPQTRHHYLEVTAGTIFAFELAATDGVRWQPVCRTERVGIPPAEPDAGAPRRVEVAGLRFETAALHMGSSSSGNAPAQEEAAPAAHKIA